MTEFARAYEEGLRLTAQGQHARAIERFERALVHEPDDVRVLFALGNTARALGLSRPAGEFFRRVLAQDPARLEALVNLANLLRSQGDFVAAEALLKPALAQNPDSAELWLTLGSVYRETGRRVLAEDHYRQALNRAPDYIPALCNIADFRADDDDVDEALALYDRALRRKDNPQARLNRAVLHLRRGNLKDGWRDYAARLKLSGKVPVADHKLPRWTGGSLKRQRLLVTAEQGVGDQVMFASIIPELMDRAAREDGSVILECEPRLVTLFARSFPSVAVKAWDAQTQGGIPRTHYGWLKSAGGATCFIETGTLPRYLRHSIQSFPNPHAYLTAEAGETARWRSKFGRAIGICWRSGKTGGERALQYAPLEAWAAFVRNILGTIVSVQYDATADEIAQLESLSGRKILVPQNIDQKNELDRACALLSSLDAVVSAPTAVSWLAAAAGVPTYKILYDKSWTSFGETHEPFGPACCCVMPKQRGDWSDSFAQTAEMLSR
ncbi:MAG TPA: tetratricopeptide repeat protein [Rhizomicrobium sp.]|jgi:Tfp pilus assembly protein PilF|nr:tetratricopeptide repeat protein [Rhizomicrobium sp.]